MSVRVSGTSEEVNRIINTRNGKVKGDIRYSHNGNCYGAFEGIPYAEPPVGERRFLRPIPIQPWAENKVLDVSNPTNIHCMQPDMPPNIPGNGTEDCLYLWVYSPAICRKNIKGNRNISLKTF